LLPSGSADLSVTRTGTGANSGNSSYNAVLNASYEIDLWGKNRAALRSAEYAAIASRFDRETIVISTVSTVINTYFQVLAAQDRLRIARDNVAAATRILNVYRERIAVGTATGLDIAQQESLLAQQRAAIPPLDQQLQQNIATLALLLGEAPSRLTVHGGSLRAIAAQGASPGLPSDLLLQRPDIREAEAQLKAADANVENARAALLPSIALTADGGFASAALHTLFIPQSAIYTLAAGATQPVFDSIRLLATLDLRRGQRTELLQLYRKAILSGFSDVERALIAIRELADQERLQTEVVTTSRRAYELSETQLRAGTIDITTVLNTQRTLFQAQDQLVVVRLTRLQAIVSLFQALGGGWVLPEEIASSSRMRRVEKGQ
jgi:NodT family efflux transporter outer membrane factor (OMF) lipoprotein